MEPDSTHDQQYWERETVSLLALSSLKGVGYWTLLKLAESGLTFNQLIKANSVEEFNNYLTQVGSRFHKNQDQAWEDFQKSLWSAGNNLYKRLKKAEVKVIHFQEHEFPKTLRHIADPPRWLFVQGNLEILHQPAVAIVGTRNPSDEGILLANYIGTCLPYFDAITVSGLATGIDQIVHRMSIRFQVPTVAVLGNGIFVNYPAGSEHLRHDILVNGGAIVTEYLPEQGYSGENFVRRNRIQAGLGNILIPAEWKSRSGTAHTVRYASSGNKPIFCLKMPDWTEKEHDELSLASELGGRVYSFPIESNEFIQDVYSTVHGKPQKYQDDVKDIDVPTGKIDSLNSKNNGSSLNQETIKQLELWSTPNETKLVNEE